MGRPRKQLPPMSIEQRPAPRKVPEPEPLQGPPPPPGDYLYWINGPEIEATPFGRATTKWLRYDLVKEGKLPCVRLGRRIYLAHSAIEKFIAEGGQR